MGNKNSRQINSKEKDAKKEPANGGNSNTGYTEIDVDHLDQNRQLNRRQSSSAGQQQTPAQNHGGKNGAPAVSPKPSQVTGMNKRIHTYDEIEVDTDRNVALVAAAAPDTAAKKPAEAAEAQMDEKSEAKKSKDKKKDMRKGKGDDNKKDKKAENKKMAAMEVQVLEAETKPVVDNEVEYANVTVVRPSEARNVDVLYSLPQKNKKNVIKEEGPKELNYIEVVVTPTTPKSPKLKPNHQSPGITYSNVMKNEVGQMVLVPET